MALSLPRCHRRARGRNRPKRRRGRPRCRRRPQRGGTAQSRRSPTVPGANRPARTTATWTCRPRLPEKLPWREVQISRRRHPRGGGRPLRHRRRGSSSAGSNSVRFKGTIGAGNDEKSQSGREGITSLTFTNRQRSLF